MKKINKMWLVAILYLTIMPYAYAGPNDFFGGGVPGPSSSGSGNASGPPAAVGPAGPGSGDYSDDEKRMQKKYKGNIQRSKDLINKGETMMKKGEAKHNDKMYKRGKVLKDIGEKSLSDLKENNPFIDPKEKFKDK